MQARHIMGDHKLNIELTQLSQDPKVGVPFLEAKGSKASF